MTKIRILDKSTGRGTILDDIQTKMFLTELDRVLPTAQPVDSTLSRVSHDAEVEVENSSQAFKSYRIYGRSTLVDVDAQECMPFYMGLLLLEWLDK